MNSRELDGLRLLRSPRPLCHIRDARTDSLSNTAVALSELVDRQALAHRDSVTDGQDHLVDRAGRLCTCVVIVDHALVARVDLAV